MKIAIVALGIVFSLSTAGSGRAANYRVGFGDDFSHSRHCCSYSRHCCYGTHVRAKHGWRRHYVGHDHRYRARRVVRVYQWPHETLDIRYCACAPTWFY